MSGAVAQLSVKTLCFSFCVARSLPPERCAGEGGGRTHWLGFCGMAAIHSHVLAGSFSSVDVYGAQANLRVAAARCRSLLLEASGDPSHHTPTPFLVVPTVMHHYTSEELLRQEAQGEVSFNSHLGTFTNFVNLLGMCAVSVPFRSFEYPAPEAQVRS